MMWWAADMKRSDTSLWPWERNWEGVDWKDRCIVLSPAIFGLILDAFFSAVYCWSSLCQSWSKTLAKSTMNINYGTALYLMACILCILCMYIMALNDFHIHICMFVIFMWYSKVSKTNMPKFNFFLNLFFISTVFSGNFLYINYTS